MLGSTRNEPAGQLIASRVRADTTGGLEIADAWVADNQLTIAVEAATYFSPTPAPESRNPTGRIRAVPDVRVDLDGVFPSLSPRLTVEHCQV